MLLKGKAKFYSVCPACRNGIIPGDAIVRVKGEWKHADCRFKFRPVLEGDNLKAGDVIRVDGLPYKVLHVLPDKRVICRWATPEEVASTQVKQTKADAAQYYIQQARRWLAEAQRSNFPATQFYSIGRAASYFEAAERIGGGATGWQEECNAIFRDALRKFRLMYLRNTQRGV